MQHGKKQYGERKCTSGLKITSIKCIYVEMYIFFCSLFFFISTRNSPMLNMSTKWIVCKLIVKYSFSECWENTFLYWTLLGPCDFCQREKNKWKVLVQGLINSFLRTSSTIWTSPGKNPGYYVRKAEGRIHYLGHSIYLVFPPLDFKKSVKWT